MKTVIVCVAIVCLVPPVILWIWSSDRFNDKPGSAPWRE